MTVLAHQRRHVAFLYGGIVLAHRRDVDEQTGRHIDPSRIDHVSLVVGRPDDVERVDFEEVRPATLHAGDVEMMLGHVVVLVKEADRRLGDLDVDIVVPRENL